MYLDVVSSDGVLGYVYDGGGKVCIVRKAKEVTVFGASFKEGPSIRVRACGGKNL